MKINLKIVHFVGLLLLSLILMGNTNMPSNRDYFNPIDTIQNTVSRSKLPKWVFAKDTVRIKDYFDYMDSLVKAFDSLTPYPLSEHLLVHANPWIIDVLANTDYYRMIERDSFVYDQKQMVVLRPNDPILVPDSLWAVQLIHEIKTTHIDVNIPEFKLRIYQDSSLLYTIPIRVGQNRVRYLKMGDRMTDMRTKHGKGKIVRHARDPHFYNPVDGKRFYFTKRDDGKTTVMPRIPWIETEINGVRNGQMIHPTTNPKTLGKASSNGCIGTSEADAWIVYYYAAIGTPVNIRYDLIVQDDNRELLVLDDIYDLSKTKVKN